MSTTTTILLNWINNSPERIQAGRSLQQAWQAGHMDAVMDGIALMEAAQVKLTLAVKAINGRTATPEERAAYDRAAAHSREARAVYDRAWAAYEAEERGRDGRL